MPEVEVVFTIAPGRPWSFHQAAAFLVMAKVARRLTLTTRSNSSGAMLNTMRSRTTPALLTRPSRPPKVSTAAATSRPAASKSATSCSRASARPPAAVTAAAVSAAPARSSTTTAAPARAQASASSRPMPCPAPVTTTTLPSSAPIAPPLVGSRLDVHDRRS